MNNEETKKHYMELIKKYGLTPQGVDWGKSAVQNN